MTNEPPSLRPSSPTLQLTIWFTLIVFVSLLVMSFVFKVEVVAKGQGRVVPIARVQVVQPEFDGKITAIHVKNGSEVSKGQVLVEFDTTEALAERVTIEAELERLRVEAGRISILVNGLREQESTEVELRQALLRDFAETVHSNDPFLLEQKELLGAEVDDWLSAMAQIEAQIDAGQKSEEVTEASIARVDAAILIQTERLKVSEDLLKRGATSRAAFLDAQEAFTQLEKEREIYLKELDQKSTQNTALFAERHSITASLRNRSLQRRSEIEARRAVLEQEVKTARRRLDGAKLRSPADGTVDRLEVFTLGGIIGAGSEILRVVPSDQEFEIEAQFANTDIGFVEMGQKANIKFDAYPAERFGVLRGTVSDVSADAIEIADAVWGYAIRINPETNELITGSLVHPIRPGMTGEVNITTDKRRIISYFFAPILKTFQSSLGER